MIVFCGASLALSSPSSLLLSIVTCLRDLVIACCLIGEFEGDILLLLLLVATTTLLYRAVVNNSIELWKLRLLRLLAKTTRPLLFSLAYFKYLANNGYSIYPPFYLPLPHHHHCYAMARAKRDFSQRHGKRGDFLTTHRSTRTQRHPQRAPPKTSKPIALDTTR